MAPRGEEEATIVRQRAYAEIFQLHPLRLNLTFRAFPRICKNLFEEKPDRIAKVELMLRRWGLVANLDAAPIRINAIVLRHAYGDLTELYEVLSLACCLSLTFSLVMPICLVYEGGCMAAYSWQVLMQHYMREGRRQWARVLGAAELLGAPGTSLCLFLSRLTTTCIRILLHLCQLTAFSLSLSLSLFFISTGTLIQHLGTGVKDLYYEPKHGRILGTHTFGRDVRHSSLDQ